MGRVARSNAAHVARRRAREAPGGVGVDGAHQAQVADDAAVADRHAGDGVPAAADRERDAGLARGADRGRTSAAETAWTIAAGRRSIIALNRVRASS